MLINPLNKRLNQKRASLQAQKTELEKLEQFVKLMREGSKGRTWQVPGARYARYYGVA